MANGWTERHTTPRHTTHTTLKVSCLTTQHDGIQSIHHEHLSIDVFRAMRQPSVIVVQLSVVCQTIIL